MGGVKHMKRQYIPVSEVFEKWREDPAFVTEYGALEGEFALAAAAIKRGSETELTRDFRKLVQEQVLADPAYAKALLDEGADTKLPHEEEPS